MPWIVTFDAVNCHYPQFHFPYLRELIELTVWHAGCSKSGMKNEPTARQRYITPQYIIADLIYLDVTAEGLAMLLRVMCRLNGK